MTCLFGCMATVRQVEDARAKGAILLAGGQRSEGPGAYYEPVVLTDVTPQVRAYT